VLANLTRVVDGAADALRSLKSVHQRAEALRMCVCMCTRVCVTAWHCVGALLRRPTRQRILLVLHACDSIEFRSQVRVCTLKTCANKALHVSLMR
jgi:hypothetical protein